MQTNLFFIVLSYLLGALGLFGYALFVMRQARQLEKKLLILGK